MVGWLFLHFQRASISKYISYYRERIPRQQVMMVIKEFDTVGNFNQDTLGHWKELMAEHNRIVERGERMLLLQGRRKMDWLKFRCLDLFMLQMQSCYLAKQLDGFSSFGERVLWLIQESPSSLFWTIGGQIVVEQASWVRLCAQMMTLLHVLGLADPSSARLQLRPWPDRALLEAAAARARGVFGRFARADTSMPSVRALLSRHRHRAPSASNAQQQVRAGAEPGAEPRRRAAKRRREDAEAPSPPPRRAADSDSKAGPEEPRP